MAQALSWFKRYHCFFNLTDHDSFNNVRMWMDEIQSVPSSDICRVLAGINLLGTDDNNLIVSPEELLLLLSQQFNCQHYIAKYSAKKMSRTNFLDFRLIPIFSSQTSFVLNCKICYYFFF